MSRTRLCTQRICLAEVLRSRGKLCASERQLKDALLIYDANEEGRQRPGFSKIVLDLQGVLRIQQKSEEVQDLERTYKESFADLQSTR